VAEPPPADPHPPSNKMTASAMVTTRWTVVTDTCPSVGTTSEATAAASKKITGAGIRIRSLIRFDTTTATKAAAVSRMTSAKGSTSLIGRPSKQPASPASWAARCGASRRRTRWVVATSCQATLQTRTSCARRSMGETYGSVSWSAVTISSRSVAPSAWVPGMRSCPHRSERGRDLTPIVTPSRILARPTPHQPDAVAPVPRAFILPSAVFTSRSTLPRGHAGTAWSLAPQKAPQTPERR